MRQPPSITAPSNWQRKRTYGRKPVSQGTRNFMDELRTSSDGRKRSADEDLSREQSNIKKICSPPAKKAIDSITTPIASELQQPPKYRFTEEEFEARISSKPLLPMPTKPTTSPPPKATRSQTTKTLRNQRKRQAKRQRNKQRGALFCQEGSNPSANFDKAPLPTPPPSTRGTPQSPLPTLPSAHDDDTDDATEEFFEAEAVHHEDITIHENIVSARGSAIERFGRELWSNIFGHILETENTVRPFYRRGMMAKAIKSECYNDAGVIDLDNVNLSILSVCKGFHSIGAKIYYSRNEFYFNDPSACS
ncbi:hypothetical protein LTR05_003652 [Lithohypha guttulata]|uniref:Uncharacterized protein n=1 Tax=Lithohypha guttulata TaxID=1690604 RepID=A0AAN7T1K9_9EURO|nr:hypothetical protein LTR05_003652 [Lithohypha guttulata]